ncbi:MAG TPA: glucose-1-phosphate thymidylyltransferase [Dehalococcoidia bacterium]|nr:glucose-1-phosphate thymidylyltransferase [Dehalococcoidia bacterium]
MAEGCPLKGLVLSGGQGTRLRPFTYCQAKQLLPVANRPVLFYALEQMAEAGIDEVGIVVGQTGPQVRQAVGDGSAFGLRVTYIEQEAPLGLAHAVLTARPFLGDGPFVVFLGDNLVAESIRPHVEAFLERRPACQLLLQSVSDPRSFGVAVVDGQRVVRVVEKPQEPPSDLAIVGVYMFDGVLWDALSGLRPSWRNELELTDAIQRLIDGGQRVEYRLLQGPWVDVGSLESILEANRVALQRLSARNEGVVDAESLLEGPVVVEAGACVERSRLTGPLVIGSGAQVRECSLGPFVAIGRDCRLERVSLQDSVVMDGAVLERIAWPLEGCLIGRQAAISGPFDDGGRFSLALADHSRIRLLDGGP